MEVTVVTPVKDAEKLSPVERWSIVHSAALATRVAIEQYIPEAERFAACDAVERIIRADAPRGLHFTDGLIDEQEIRTNGQISPRESGPY